MSAFTSSAQSSGDTLRLTLAGTIDEDVTFPKVEDGPQTKIVIDLKDIKTINSVGIREWLNWIKPLTEKFEIVLENCPKAMVFQFNMVEGFLPPKAKVTSFFVPFYCESCDREDNVLFTVGKEVSGSNGQVKIDFDLPKANLCGKGEPCEVEMDVTEAKYFQFLKRA
ncbi:MAG: hypothetical protein V4692_15700 [Bdellovibrionota bacterium]